ncbi:MAG: Inosine-5'-monophosphate dehydrogenase [Pelotomaculum sp. PtaU1.Bin035]|nr:MAG: Inosine-5'-monophosphate dehydrogenase [Pelotomaculum sp. PtaU1.Bin035]
MNNGQFFPKVADVMTREVITITSDSTVRQAKEIMRLNCISGMPVVDQEKVLIGIISVADIIRVMEENDLDAKVSKIMTTNPVFLREQDTVGQALSANRQYKYGRFPVLDEKSRVVGILTASDIVARLAQLLKIDQVEEHDESKGPKDFTMQTIDFHIHGMNFEKAGEAASTIKKILTDLGLRKTVIRRAAIAAYDAEMNVVIHAYEGRLIAHITPEDVTIKAMDIGPGIEDISLAMQPGYSTAPDQIRRMGFGAGMGLPNIKKSADEFSIESSPRGTTLVIKILVE